YWWSPDSKSIAFLRTDESGVDIMSFTDFEPYQPRILTQRYPKAGRKTPDVRVGFVGVGGGDPVWMNLPRSSYEYITGVDWLPRAAAAAVQTMNRAETKITLYLVRSADGGATPLLTESDDAWVHIYHPLFLNTRSEFLWISDRTGYAQAYRYTLDGKLLAAVTEGERPLRPHGAFAIYGESALQAVDEKEGWVYFTAAGESSLERQIYRVPIGGGKPVRLPGAPGFHRPSFRSDGRYYVDEFSDARTPPALTLHAASGGPPRVIAAPRAALIPEAAMRYPAFFRIPAADSFALPAQLSTPAGFDSTKKYPLIIYVYGGPGSPSVLNAWNANGWAESVWFDQVLLGAGFLVASVDNRSSSCEGKVYEKTILGQMYGDVELGDLLSAVRYFKRLPYVDSSRVGLWGWSGGGMYTLLALTRSKEFRAGIAVAPVTDWHYYDAKWAELPMKRPEDNPAGYAHTSLVARAGDLHGRLLLVHGTDDDNVHPQNSQAFMNVLIREGILFDLMVYPMRKHTIDDPPAKKHLFRTMLRFWQNNL
ncbi:MAG TPA: DPP IV N-terminal domain-containing protein, partial [Bacteroidota bacterium]|nr:DPP IV N-terminal domain-containing protein [Bacteroidota bacterium]